MVLRRLFGDRNAESSPVQPIVGGIYSIVHNPETGEFGVVKILAVDADAVHIRSYVNRYRSRPDAVNPATLSLGGGLTKLPDGGWGPPDGPMGIGHMPLTHASFHHWEPQLMTVEPVADDELEGYRYWVEDGGGVFG